MNNALDYVILTDSTCDLTKDQIRDLELDVIQLSFTLNGNTYKGQEVADLDTKEFYNAVRNGSMPKTAQVNPEDAEKFLEKYLKNGQNILYIAFSSALSGTYNSVKIAAEELSPKYEAQAIVIDSLSASMGEGLMIYYAVQMKRQGKSIDELAAWIEENKLHFCHMFTVDDLHHLHRGGRVSKASAVFGTMLGVKPVLHVDDEGRLIPVSKVRGRKQSLTALVDAMEKKIPGYQNEVVFISHGDSEEDARFVGDLVKQRFGIKNVFYGVVGPVIGSHSGPGTIALFFRGSKR